MVLPLALVVKISTGVVALSGTVFAAIGAKDMRLAHKSRKDSISYHAQEVGKFDVRRARAQNCLEDYGLSQLQVQRDTLGAFAEWLEANEYKVRTIDHEVVAGVEVKLVPLPQMKIEVAEATGLLEDAASAVVTGMAARQAALSGVSALFNASTGTAISTLTGAAAENAALAWLGGGSLASGGGGMAAGATVLSGITVAPAILITGISLGIQGHKAKTRAAKLRAQVDVSVERMRLASEILDQIIVRARELQSVLFALNSRTIASLTELASLDFDPDKHAEQFLRTAQLIRSVSEVLDAELLDSEGNLTDESIEIIKRNRDEYGL